MFTGIVEEIGTIEKIERGAASIRLNLICKEIQNDLKVGDSVSVNGVCLTADRVFNGGFAADVMPETMRKTSLGSLKIGSYVNLERAMSANGRFGGHIVSGHIDGVGRINNLSKEDNAVWMEISADPELMIYMVHKGSITIDGVSLTVARLSKNSFSVSLIPHTAQKTILLQKGVGDIVNLECDVIGKYIQKFINKEEQDQTKSNIDIDFLKKNGF